MQYKYAFGQAHPISAADLSLRVSGQWQCFFLLESCHPPVSEVALSNSIALVCALEYVQNQVP
jgi:hypothetical protein